MFSFERFLGLGETGASFSVQLRCFSAPFFQKYDTQKINELNYGGKILLPNSCLDNLIRRHIQWPMLFKLTNLNPAHQKSTHAGVLEFLAEEGKCYLPSWMMNQLCLLEGDLLLVEYRSLPPATYAKFKPMSTDFYHVTNPKAMLEVELRKFACLTKGDIIAVQYNEQIFEFKVMELKPQNAVTIIECDINIEFDAVDGYVEPTEVVKTDQSAENQANKDTTGSGQTGITTSEREAFSGGGQRLDGKRTRTTSSTSGVAGGQIKQVNATSLNQTSTIQSSQVQIVVDENYAPGELCFIRTVYKNKAILEKFSREKDGVAENKFFMGEGQTIRGHFSK